MYLWAYIYNVQDAKFQQEKHGGMQCETIKMISKILTQYQSCQQMRTQKNFEGEQSLSKAQLS